MKNEYRIREYNGKFSIQILYKRKKIFSKEIIERWKYIDRYGIPMFNSEIQKKHELLNSLKEAKEVIKLIEKGDLIKYHEYP